VTADLLLGVVMIGMGVGFLSGAFGKGGSAVATPLLHLIGVPAIAAIASPLPATIPSTWLASRPYARAGNIDQRVVRMGLPVGIPATAVGALLTRWIPGGPLIIITDVIVLAFGLRILIGALTSEPGADGAREDASADTRDARVTTMRVIAIVGAVGFVSGLLGNSGGFLLAPLFMAVLDMPIHRALGTSLLLATCLAVPGTIVHWWLGHIDWSLTLAFGIACVPAAIFGAQVALRTSRRSLSLAYGFGLATMGGGLLALAH
jgi:uncharacterized membrane protein YfcA